MFFLLFLLPAIFISNPLVSAVCKRHSRAIAQSEDISFVMAPTKEKTCVFFFVLAVLAGSTQTSATTCPATTAEGLANRPFSFSSNWAMRRRERDKPAGSYIQVLHGPQTFQLAGGESITVPIRFQVKRGGAKPTAEWRHIGIAKEGFWPVEKRTTISDRSFGES